MSLTDARNDLQEIIQGEFSQNIKVTSPVGFSVNVKGVASKHHVGIDPETGRGINTKNAHCSFSEKSLNDLGYVTRNTDKEVSMIGHVIETADNTGVVKKYRINEAFPDETLGLIVCMLGDSN